MGIRNLSSLLSFRCLIGLGAAMAISLALHCACSTAGSANNIEQDLPVRFAFQSWLPFLTCAVLVLCLLVHRSVSGLATMEKGLDKESSSSGNEKAHHPNDAHSGNQFMRRRVWVVILVALMLLIFALTLGLGLGLYQNAKGDGSGSDPVVDLGYSQYRGKAFSDGTSQWLGMRYAAAPIGPLRFAAPRDPLPTKRVQSAVAVSRPASASPFCGEIY